MRGTDQTPTFWNQDYQITLTKLVIGNPMNLAFGTIGKLLMDDWMLSIKAHET